MKILLSLVLLGLALGARLRSQQPAQEDLITFDECMKVSRRNATACHEIVECQANSADCDVVQWALLQASAATCYKTEQPDWDGSPADASDVPDLVACIWEAFCEQMLGQTPNWCVRRWADRHEEAEEYVSEDASSLAKSKGAETWNAGLNFATTTISFIAKFF